MPNLEPSEVFPICWQADDPLNTDTLYVQAIIRDAVTDATLDTVNLTDQGSQRFRGTWQVTDDPSGSGRYVTITTKVYTDVNYSNQSEDFAIEEIKYLIQARYSRTLGGGTGAGGDYTDYKKLKKIVRKELGKLPQPVKPEKINLKPLIRVFKKIKGGIDEAKKQTDINSQSIINAIDTRLGIKTTLDKDIIIRAIKDKHIPEPEKIDLAPFQQAIQEAVQLEAQNIVKQITGLPKPEQFDYKHISDALADGLEQLRAYTEDLYETKGKQLLETIKEDRNVNINVGETKKKQKKTKIEIEGEEEEEQKIVKETDDKQRKFDRRISKLTRKRV